MVVNGGQKGFSREVGEKVPGWHAAPSRSPSFTRNAEEPFCKPVTSSRMFGRNLRALATCGSCRLKWSSGRRAESTSGSSR